MTMKPEVTECLSNCWAPCFIVVQPAIEWEHMLQHMLGIYCESRPKLQLLSRVHGLDLALL